MSLTPIGKVPSSTTSHSGAAGTASKALRFWLNLETLRLSLASSSLTSFSSSLSEKRAPSVLMQVSLKAGRRTRSGPSRRRLRNPGAKRGKMPHKCKTDEEKTGDHEADSSGYSEQKRSKNRRMTVCRAGQVSAGLEQGRQPSYPPFHEACEECSVVEDIVNNIYIYG